MLRRTRGNVLEKDSGYFQRQRQKSTYILTISGGIPDTDDDPVAIGRMADVNEVDITYTSRIGMWQLAKGEMRRRGDIYTVVAHGNKFASTNLNEV